MSLTSARPSSHPSEQHQAAPSLLAALLRLVAVALIVGAALLSVTSITTPAVGGLPDGATFDINRTLDSLRVIAAEPRPMGSPGIAATRAYLIGEIQALGLEPDIQIIDHTLEAPNMVSFATATNIAVRLPGSSSTGAVLIGAHYDSVATTVGASDCGGCAAVVLEVLRALAAAPPLLNDVIFLWVDGEEVMRSSQAWVDSHPWAADVRAAINMEAMGATGSSQIYVHGDQSGWMLDEAFNTLPHPRGFSFVNELVWATGTGGSDLDQYLQRADVGIGFGYFGASYVYHSPTDNLDSLDPQTLQQQGENVLTLATRIANAPLDPVRTEPNPIYFNLVGDVMVRYPAALVVPLAIAAAVVLIGVIAVGSRRKKLSWLGVLAMIPIYLIVLIVIILAAAAVWSALRLLDPRLHVFLIAITYQAEGYLIVLTTLIIALFSGAALVLKRWFKPDTLLVGALGLLTVLGLVTAFVLPGVSHLFVIPALITLVAWLFLGKRGGVARAVVLTVVGIAVVVIDAPFLYFMSAIYGGRAELLAGAPMIPILTAVAAVPLVLALLPQFEWISGKRGLVPLGALIVFAAALVVVQANGNFSEAHPKPNLIVYEYDTVTQEASWVTFADTINGRTGASLIDPYTAQFIGDDASNAVEIHDAAWWGFALFPGHSFGYRASAPAADLPAPTVELLETMLNGAERRLRLQVNTLSGADTLEVQLSSTGVFESASVNGIPISTEIMLHEAEGFVDIMCFTIPESGLTIDLSTAAAEPVEIKIAQVSYHLPTFPDFAITPRESWMMAAPTQRTDSTIVLQTYTMSAEGVLAQGALN